MKILAIETSCDETAISLVEAEGGMKNPQFKVLSDITVSQIKMHRKYGGVFPNLAKREHSKNLIPIFKKILEETNFLKLKVESIKPGVKKNLETLLIREPELLEQFLKFIPKIEKPPIDKIAVTYGPGLEPALWVGINFAKALSLVWNLRVIPVNHMEGHIASILIPQNQNGEISNFQLPISKKAQNLNPKKLKAISYPSTRAKLSTGHGKLKASLEFPAIALLISGGHTELVLIKKWGDYKVVGKTRDDAVGECFDKVARMLGLSYPGGPEISRLANRARKLEIMNHNIKFPRPMINSIDLDFSFSGLKTSVLYYLDKHPAKTLKQKQEIAKEFEDAAVEVLIAKTKKAIDKYKIKSLIVGGGVSANKFLRKSLTESLGGKMKIFIPSVYLSTDNALMIAATGYIKHLSKKKTIKKIKAEGNLSL